MWFESVYDNPAYDPYEEAFEIADFERRFRREHQFDDCDDEKSSTPKLNVSFLVFQNGIVKLNMFFNKN